MGVTSGGGYATLAYYNALNEIFPNNVDGAMPEEFCVGHFKDFIPIPRRNIWQNIFSFSIHRIKSFIIPFLKKEGEKYGICVINGGVYAGDMMDYIHSFGIKIVVIHHNYETEYYMTNKSLLTLKGKFPYLISYNEKRAYQKADMNLFLTQPDMDTFEKVYGGSKGRNYLIGVFETEKREHKPSKCESKYTMVATGSLCTYQTIHSLLGFEMNYFDVLKEFSPSYKLVIAGRDPSREILDLESRHKEDVIVIGSPENMDFVTDMGAIYLCTTSVGGGLKLRLMDGLKRGMAVLTHKVSARGYEPFFSYPYFQVYDNLESFKEGLKTIKEQLDKNDNNFPNEIINTYKKYFGYESGVSRLRFFFQDFNSKNII